MVFRRNFSTKIMPKIWFMNFSQAKQIFGHNRVPHVSFIINLLFNIRWVMTQKKKNDHQQKAYSYFA